jgi:ribosomal protein L37AE/L43A
VSGLCEPRGGLDYPGGELEFERWFGNELVCLFNLLRVRWPDGFVCPGCGGRNAWLTARGLYRCADCGRQTAPTAGTIFAGSRKPLSVWFEALWALASAEGVSAEALREDLDLGSYQTAWAWLHKLRRTMAEPESDCLSGVVEVDVFVLLGIEGGMRRDPARAVFVAIAAEVVGGETGRLRLARLPNDGPLAIGRFAAQAVAPGARLRAPRELRPGLTALGYRCDPLPERAGRYVELPYVGDVARQLEKWCSATHGSAIRARQLDFYLAEFAFRFNHRAEPHGLRFYRLLAAALASGPRPARSLVGGTEVAEPQAEPTRPSHQDPEVGLASRETHI